MSTTIAATAVRRPASGIQVLHVLPYFRPAFGFGGPATVADLLTESLAKMGYQVTVWTSNVLDSRGARIASSEEEPVLTVVRFRYLFRSLFVATSVLITPGMVVQAILNPQQFDVVHVHDLRSVQSICALLYARRQEIPIVLQPHGTIKIVLGKERLKRLYDRLFGRMILAYSSRVVVLSHAEANEARRAGVPDAKIAIVPNGVQLPNPGTRENSGRFRRKHQINDRSFLVLFMGRVRASKGVFLLLDAFATFAERHPDSVLAVCGPDDGAATPLRLRAERLGLTLCMPGLVTGTEKAAAFIDSDVFCLPSAIETQSVSLLEAASYGLPIVAAKASVPSEFVESDAGIFVALEKWSVAEGLARVASSPDLRATLGARARAVVQNHFSAEAHLAAIRKVYDSVL